MILHYKNWDHIGGMKWETDRHTDWLKALCAADVERACVDLSIQSNGMAAFRNVPTLNCCCSLKEKRLTYSPFTNALLCSSKGKSHARKYVFNIDEQIWTLLYHVKFRIKCWSIGWLAGANRRYYMSGKMFRQVHSMGWEYRDSGSECISKAFIDRRGRALVGNKR